MSTYSDFTTDATAISKGLISVDTANPINQISFDVGSFLHVMDNTGIFSLDGKQRVIDGDVSFPAYSFTNDPTSGIYLSALNQYAFACDGADVLVITNGGPKFNFFRLQDVANPIASSDAATKDYVDTAVGTVAFPLYATPADDETAPSYSWDADSGTGLYNHGGAAIGMAVSGVSRATLDLIGMRVFAVNSTGYGLDNEYSAYDVQTPTNATATWLLTHHNDDLTFRSGIQSHNNDSTVSLYADTNYLSLNSTSGLKLQAGVMAVPGYTGSSNPTYTFTGETDTGMYNSALGAISFASNTVAKLTINTNGVLLHDKITAQPGTSTNPSYSFATFNGNGMYNPGGGNNVTIVSNSVDQLIITPTAATFTNQIVASTGTATAPSYCFTGDTNTGIYHAVAAETFGFASNGSSKATVDTLGVHIATGNGLYLPDGSAASPALRFEQDVTNNAGFYRSGTGAVTFVSGVGGVDRVKMDATGLTVMGAGSGNIKTTYGGINTAPAYSFAGDTDTGIYSDSLNVLKFACGANTVLTLGMFSLDVYQPIFMHDNYISGVSSISITTTSSVYKGGILSLDEAGFSFPSTNGLVIELARNDAVTSQPNVAFYSSTIDGAAVWSVCTQHRNPTVGPDGFFYSVAGDRIHAQEYSACIASAGSESAVATVTVSVPTVVSSANYTGRYAIKLRDGASSVDKLVVDVTGTAITGSVSTTSMYNFISDTGTGFIRNGTGDVSIVCSLSTAMQLKSNEVYFPATLTGTTASAGNAYLDSLTGRLQRSTSSLKYKQDVVDIEDSSFIYNLRAVSFTPKSDLDIRCDGLIAEEVALVNERYVHMTNGEPDGVQYDRLVAPLIAEMQKMNARIAQLEAIIANNH